MKAPIPTDITELVANPVRTGIQRVVRAILSAWTGPRPLLLCRYDPDQEGLVPLPSSTIDLLLDRSGDGEPLEGLRARVAATLQARGAPRRAMLPEGDKILIPEIFYDARRCAFHAALEAGRPGSLHLIAYDFIPWLQPALLGVESTDSLMPYLRLVAGATPGRVASISAATRADLVHRIRRRPYADPAVAGPVIPLGADGLAGGQRQIFSPDRDTLLALGSIDGRKGQERVARAVARLRQTEAYPLRLVIVGRAFGSRVAEEAAREIARLAAAEPGAIRWQDEADDAAVAALLGRVRATVYLSRAEGYGLPPMEGLAVGIPALVASGVPSTADLPLKGLIRLAEPIDDAAIDDALRRVAEPDTVGGLWRDASALDLPGWRHCADAVATWVHETPMRRAP